MLARRPRPGAYRRSPPGVASEPAAAITTAGEIEAIGESRGKFLVTDELTQP